MNTRQRGAEAERRADCHYRLRGYRILDANVWAGGNELDLVVRRGRRLVFCEVKQKSGPGFGDPHEMVTEEKQRRLRRAADGVARAHPRLAGSRRLRRRRRLAGRAAADQRRVLADRACIAAGAWVDQDSPPGRRCPRWLRHRTLCTPTSTSSSRGRSATSPKGSGRSTFTGSTPTWGSSSFSSSRRCSSGTSSAASTCSIRSPGSGTTLVQALESGLDATGADVSAFNCLLVRVGGELRPVRRRERIARRVLARLCGAIFTLRASVQGRTFATGSSRRPGANCWRFAS